MAEEENYCCARARFSKKVMDGSYHVTNNSYFLIFFLELVLQESNDMGCHLDM